MYRNGQTDSGLMMSCFSVNSLNSHSCFSENICPFTHVHWRLRMHTHTHMAESSPKKGHVTGMGIQLILSVIP